MDELKKPLKVQFVGEQAVDEGGVTKEFFQIIVRQLFQPEFGAFSHYGSPSSIEGRISLFFSFFFNNRITGMFQVSEETNVYWFAAYSLESAVQFQLVGTVSSCCDRSFLVF